MSSKRLPARRTLPVIAGLLIAGILLSGGPAAARKLYPRDDAKRDPSFLAFRTRLVRALHQHDRRFLESILDPEIACDFGEQGSGRAAFRRDWHPEQKNSQLWGTLLEILALGGTFDRHRQFCAPYVFGAFPNDLDAFSYACVTVRRVALRREPRDDAPTLETLSYDIVKVADGKTHDSRWLKVVSPRGRTGYVPRRSVRSSIDYRACFAKRHGRWRMSALIGGD